MPLTAEKAINLISRGVEIYFFNAPLKDEMIMALSWKKF